MFKKALCVAAIMGFFFSGYGKAGAEDVWYTKNLMDGQQYVADFTLAPGESKTVSVDAAQDLRVGFKADISMEKGQEYFANKENPISIAWGDVILSSTYGASRICTPSGGKIESIVTNNAKEGIKVVIYTAKE